MKTFRDLLKEGLSKFFVNSYPGKSNLKIDANFMVSEWEIDGKKIYLAIDKEIDGFVKLSARFDDIVDTITK